ncbi:hypothetical protein R1sor_010720 [Riccia sorocarpa]|uniref:tRNA-5-taurinomethyluridine 2-sulfurtransferase n=1 Tax=Riccia sorocarpa TaxID=122646 RepID=A0ABD3I297_9MARC
MCALVDVVTLQPRPPLASIQHDFRNADFFAKRTWPLRRCLASSKRHNSLTHTCNSRNRRMSSRSRAPVGEFLQVQQVTDEQELQERVGAAAIGVLGNTRPLDLSVYNESGNVGRGVFLDWRNDERVQRSCEAGKALRVAVLVSGGVDSSVALRLLCDAGHSCTAFYLKIWFQEDFENFWSACPWEEDLGFAQSVCDEVGVELKVVHLTDAYWAKVVSESLAEIRAGRTPNPDMLCNSKIKFGEFLDHIIDSPFDRIASGHYARVERVDLGSGDQIVELCSSPDAVKDQTYFLSQLTPSQMSRLMFPIGGLTKAEVRGIAAAMGLANKQRKDSQGICFLGKVKFSEFIERHLGEKEGFMLEAETGEILGVHRGFWFYTIGQRQGLRLSNGPWFVVAKDVEHNVIFISRKYFSEKKRRSFTVGSLNWISGHKPSDVSNMRCKVRHGPKMYNCSFEFDIRDDDLSTAVVLLAEDDQGIAPGQYAAFYQSDVCLGSGVILESLGEDQQVNVSPVALEAARNCVDLEVWKHSKDAKSRSAGILKGNVEQRRRGSRLQQNSNVTENVTDSCTLAGTPLALSSEEKAPTLERFGKGKRDRKPC